MASSSAYIIGLVHYEPKKKKKKNYANPAKKNKYNILNNLYVSFFES
jgi:hypothetical protein